MIFANVNGIGIPEGIVKQITCNGVVLWSKPYGDDIWPDSYQIVEYIESTGTQLINTGVVPDGKTEFDIKVYTTGLFNRSSGNGNIFGTINSANSNSKKYTLTTYGVYSATDGGGTFSINTKSIAPGMDRLAVMEMGLHNGIFTKPNGTTVSVGSVSFTGAGPIGVFGAYRSDGTVLPAAFATRVYSLKFYSSGIPIRNFIPCYRKKDREAGLYDAVNDVFYANVGSGSFIVGPDVDS